MGRSVLSSTQCTPDELVYASPGCPNIGAVALGNRWIGILIVVAAGCEAVKRCMETLKPCRVMKQRQHGSTMRWSTRTVSGGAGELADRRSPRRRDSSAGCASALNATIRLVTRQA